jgi:NADP-dependent 3-hydroxy acid dehydrogenase YdfG
MKTIIVTGSSDGLGFQIAKKFNSEGWKVVGISRHKPDNLDIEYIKADLSTKSGIQTAVQEIKKNYSDFNAIINCAGVLNLRKLEDINFEETENLLKLNLMAPMMLVSGLKNSIISNEADILNIGSSIAFKAYENQTAYGSSKWGLRGLNENLRLEFKGTDVRVVSFNPGGFKSKLFEKASGEKINLDKFMDPKDLADIVFFIINTPKTLEVSEILINRK